jgi:hypothetical protein
MAESIIPDDNTRHSHTNSLDKISILKFADVIIKAAQDFKASVQESNRDSNSPGGTLNPLFSYRILPS